MMRFAVFWLTLFFLAGSGFSDAAAQAVSDAPVSECEQARRDWTANHATTLPENANERVAYLRRSIDTSDLRFDLDCDHRLSFDEYLSKEWDSWRQMDANGDGAVNQAEYVAEWCTRRIGGLLAEQPDWLPACQEASVSNFLGHLGSRRPGGIDQRAYRYTAQIQFRRADRNRDRYLTRPPHSAHFYE